MKIRNKNKVNEQRGKGEGATGNSDVKRKGVLKPNPRPISLGPHRMGVQWTMACCKQAITWALAQSASPKRPKENILPSRARITLTRFKKIPSNLGRRTSSRRAGAHRRQWWSSK